MLRLMIVCDDSSVILYVYLLKNKYAIEILHCVYLKNRDKKKWLIGDNINNN